MSPIQNVCVFRGTPEQMTFNLVTPIGHLAIYKCEEYVLLCDMDGSIEFGACWQATLEDKTSEWRSSPETAIREVAPNGDY